METPALSIGEVMDSRPLGRFQMATILLCSLVIVFDGFDTQSIGLLAPSMSENLNIPLKYFGTILSAALFGLMIASLVVGPIADRLGRKWVLVLSVFTFAFFMTLTARATSFEALLILRFLTGLGLGGAIPNAVSLACEYAPKRLVPTIVGCIMAGMPLGQVLAGRAATLLLPTQLGWRAVFYVGGVLPILVATALILWLPESVRFLAVRGGDKRKIAHILRRISPELAELNIRPEHADNRARKGLPVRHLFTEGRTPATLLLWVPFFMNLLILYFIVSWLPAMLRQVHMPISAGVAAATIFGLGSIPGSIVQGPLTTRFGSYALLLSEFGLCVALCASLGWVATSFRLVMAVAFVLGFTVTGIQAGLNSLAASFYPTSMRSTGVGWALGIGRIGSVTGPILGGILLKIGWTPQQILAATAGPALCAGLAIVLSYRLRGSASAYRTDPADVPVISH